ncbi:unnamed protein product [Lactuca saligna]|uniref:Helitron helicase-like domain-containing protein n=1 Tax=Lactuca saligna TaxID=75948 RepID=A0AA36E2M1_LACSI|nr:unnamed protein product [Lactuca saligna]
MEGRLYSINHFKLNSTPDDFPKYEGYNFVDDQYVIIVNQATRFTLVEPVIENHFPTYPLVKSIEYLVRNPRQRNLIDVVGKLILNDGPEALPFKLARSIQEKWIIYVSRVKYRSRGGMNFLDSTSISRVAFEPCEIGTQDSENENEDLTQISLDIEKEVGGSSEVHVNHVIPDDILLEDPYHSIFDGIPEVHSILEGSNICVHCGAKRFKNEFATFCCMSGKTKLASSKIPDELYRLFTSEEELSKIFRDTIRAYNTNFYFTSMGVELDDDLSNMKSGVYTFRANGAIYHRIDQLVPRDGLPRYLQLYFYDSETDFTHRLQWPNIDRKIIQVLVGVLSINPYATTFRSLRELGPLDNYKVTLNASVET